MRIVEAKSQQNSRHSILLSSPFTLPIMTALFGYLAIQLIYIQSIPLNMDEFQSLETTHGLWGIPYRDFNPFKTVLSYYIHKIPTFFTEDFWNQAFLIRMQMAIFVAITLFIGVFKLKKYTSGLSLFINLILFITVTNFLEYSNSIRADMLTSLFGFLAFQFLFDRRFIITGIFLTLSYFCSQKGLFFIIATTVSIFCQSYRSKQIDKVKDILYIYLPCFIGLIFYLVFFGRYTEISDVFLNVFIVPIQTLLNDTYHLQYTFWLQTLLRNPLFYLLSCIYPLMVWKYEKQNNCDRHLVPYSLALVFCCLIYPQPWPYFFVMLIPTLFLCNTRCCDYIFMRITDLKYSEPIYKNFSLFIVLLMYVLGIWYQSRWIPYNFNKSQDHQKITTTIARRILNKKDQYYAGVALLPDFKQNIDELKNLDRHQASIVNNYTNKRKEGLYKRFKYNAPKLVIHNYRLYFLPEKIRHFIDDNYTHLYGNLFTYAPVINPNNARMYVSVSGKYDLSSSKAVKIDKKIYESNDTVTLKKGYHTLDANAPFKLILQLNLMGKPLTKKYNKPYKLFDNVYG